MHKIIQYGLWTGSALALALTLVACGTNGSKNRCSSDNDCAGDRVCTQNQTCSSIGTSLNQSPNLPAIGEDLGPTPGSGGGGGVASCSTLCAHVISLCPEFIDELAECEADCAEEPITAELSTCILNAPSCQAVFLCENDSIEWEEENGWESPPSEPTNPGTPGEPTQPDPPPFNGTSGGLDLCELIDCYEGCQTEACGEACEASAAPSTLSQVDRLEACFDICEQANDFEACIVSTCPDDFNEYLSC